MIEAISFPVEDHDNRRPGLPLAALMQLDAVTRSFGRGKRRRTVLSELSLDVNPGTIIQVQGSNGAGKTTLLRIMTGILRPDAGDVRLAGRSPEQGWREYHRRIGFLSAGDRGLYVRLSVHEHLRYWCALAFVPRSQRTTLIKNALSDFQLEELADRRSERLSQGQRQRLRLALAFVHCPQVVLLDEPRNSLDPAGLGILATAARDVVHRRGAVIWCCPPQESQPVHFDRSLILDDGRLSPA